MKKRNKVSAEFSMSSLTDIIFLLLIFFMLTSSMVQINVQLPISSSTTIAPSDLIVMMTKDGRLTFNGKTTTSGVLMKQISDEIKRMTNRENAAISIVSEIGVPWKRTNEIIVIASKLKVKAHLATQPKS